MWGVDGIWDDCIDVYVIVVEVVCYVVGYVFDVGFGCYV